jgi:hypothetical protein
MSRVYKLHLPASEDWYIPTLTYHGGHGLNTLVNELHQRLPATKRCEIDTVERLPGGGYMRLTSRPDGTKSTALFSKPEIWDCLPR